MMEYVNTFPPGMRVDWIAADIETHTLINGVCVSETEIRTLAREKPVAWFRKNSTVDPYAWLVSNGKYFAILPNFEEFQSFCAFHEVGACWWYNAKFDFACIDYALLSNKKWTLCDSKKMPVFSFSSLHSEFGARYMLKICAEGRKKPVSTAHYDFCNIFPGGLKKLLEDFDVKDDDGQQIRKLEMNYQNETDTLRALKYMKNDVDGLFHAIRIADRFLFEEYGYHIAGRKPSIMTAAGLAKKIMLKFLYGGKDAENKKLYRRDHFCRFEVDEWLRTSRIFQGGKTLINPAYKGKDIQAPLYKYDFNSHYPACMAEMPDISFHFKVYPFSMWRDTVSGVSVFEITSISATLKDGCVPVWYHPVTREYTDIVDFSSVSDGRLLMFADEIDELKHWYEIDLTISRVFVFKATKNPFFSKFVNVAYEGKRAAKETNNKIKGAFCKLLLNSAYGKFAENPRREKTHREISPETGAVHLVDDGEDVDEKGAMNILQGAYITMRARVVLMQKIRDICPCPARDFVYCDTDSVHSLTKYENTDPLKLGKMKSEADPPYARFKYLAPKTYIEYRVISGSPDYEIHAKGVNISAIMTRVSPNGVFLPVDEVFNIFSVGEKFQSLSGMNVPGGKALIPIPKYICIHAKDEFANDEYKGGQNDA